MTGSCGLAPSRRVLPGTSSPVGELTFDLPAPDPAIQIYDSRAVRILAVAYAPLANTIKSLIDRWSAERIGVVVGTSASGNLDLERAFSKNGAVGYPYHARQSFGAQAVMLRELAGVRGPVVTVSTACSSGANAIVTAARWIQAGVCSAVVAASVDALCKTTYHGFSGLGVMDSGICRPFDRDRHGLNLGEGAGIMVLAREQMELSGSRLTLAGWGTASQAYHMTAPDPDGNGAVRTMTSALEMAGIGPSAIGYINLHGTATPLNDVAEAKGVERVFGRTTPASSTKGVTGHALGAAAGIEAAITLAVLRSGRLPPNANLVEVDPEVGIPILTQAVDAPQIEFAMSNSFAFGGNDASLVFAVSR